MTADFEERPCFLLALITQALRFEEDFSEARSEGDYVEERSTRKKREHRQRHLQRARSSARDDVNL